MIGGQQPTNETELALQKAILDFVQPTPQEWETFWASWKVKPYEKLSFLTREGEVERYFYFVLKGIQRLFFLTEDGYEHILGFSYAGNFSGVADSFLAQQPSRLYLQALTSTEMLVISFEEMNSLFDQFKVWERWGRLFFTQILVGRSQREIEMLTLSAETRFLRFMERQPDILQQIPQKYLASYLGMTPETFSRLRKKVR